MKIQVRRVQKPPTDAGDPLNLPVQPSAFPNPHCYAEFANEQVTSLGQRNAVQRREKVRASASTSGTWRPRALPSDRVLSLRVTGFYSLN